MILREPEKSLPGALSFVRHQWEKAAVHGGVVRKACRDCENADRTRHWEVCELSLTPDRGHRYRGEFRVERASYVA